VNNANGEVTIIGIIGSAFVNVANGTIKSGVTLPLHGTIDLNMGNGNINLAIPTHTSAGFSAMVSIGSISVSNLVLQNEVSTPTSRRGKIGNGQGTISLGTGNGHIRVSGF
jgi:hypothetical protein